MSSLPMRPVQPPHPTLPGATIQLTLRLDPEEHRPCYPQVNLTFSTKQPAQPPSQIIPPTPMVPPPGSDPEWASRDTDANQRAQQSYQQALFNEQMAWQNAHPIRTFTVSASTSFGPDGVVTITVKIPDPTSQTLQPGESAESGELYKGIYQLRTIDIIAMGVNETPIKYDGASQAVLDSYQLLIERDYLRHFPLPPKTEVITNLTIAPPVNPAPRQEQQC